MSISLPSTMPVTATSSNANDRSDATHDLEAASSSPERRVLSTITNSLQNVLKMDPPITLGTTKRLRALQAKLPPGQAEVVPADDSVTKQLVVTSNRIHVVMQKIGEGTYSRVFKATAVPTVRHKLINTIVSPSKPFPVALKVGKNKSFSFSPEKKQVEAATSGKFDGVDISHDTFKDANGFAYSVNECFDADAFHHPFHLSQQPVQSILEFLIPVTSALANMHSENFIHRDIKGPNLLVKAATALSNQALNLTPIEDSRVQVTGAVTDFGFLTKEKDHLHKTTTTLTYLDPAMFGTAEENLINQRKRRGIQTAKGDVFALGMTLDTDILRRFVKGISQQLPSSQNILNELMSLDATFTTAKSEPFTDDFLREMGEISNYRVIYFESFNGQKEKLMHLPQLQKIRIVMKPILMGLSTILGDAAANALVELCELSCQMQEIDVRPTTQEVLVKLIQILHTLQSVKPSDDSYEEWSAPNEKSSGSESIHSLPNKKRRLSGAQSAVEDSDLDPDGMGEDLDVHKPRKTSALSRMGSTVLASRVATSSPKSSRTSNGQKLNDPVKENGKKNNDSAHSINSPKSVKRPLDLEQEIEDDASPQI